MVAVLALNSSTLSPHLRLTQRIKPLENLAFFNLILEHDKDHSQKGLDQISPHVKMGFIFISASIRSRLGLRKEPKARPPTTTTITRAESVAVLHSCLLAISNGNVPTSVATMIDKGMVQIEEDSSLRRKGDVRLLRSYGKVVR